MSIKKWNKNNFSIYTSEEKTVLRLIEDIGSTLNEMLKIFEENGYTIQPNTDQEEDEIIPAVGYSNDKLNIISFANEQGIDTSEDWANAFIQAIQYCILNKRALYIPNGTYNINKEIVIESNEELGLVIEGESKSNVHLKFKGDSIEFKNIENTIDYQKRIRFINIKNLTIERQDKSERVNKGLRFKNFGYILLENIRIRDFETGLHLYNGSELDMYNSEIMGNALGIYMTNPIESEKAYDMANINFYSCRVHNNNASCVMDNTREVNFNYCALMNYTGGFTLNGITNLINFNGCDFENQEGTSDLIINSKGIINITNCTMNNPHPNKIQLRSNCTLNIKGTLIQGNVLKTIVVYNNANPKITNDTQYLGYYFEGTKDFSNYTKPNLINIANREFEKGVPFPFSFSVPYNSSTGSATGPYSVLVDRQSTTPILFNLNLEKLPCSIRPTYVEVIVSESVGSNNLLMVQFKDGTYKKNFEVGGGDACIGKIAIDGINWLKLAYLLPPHDEANPITVIGLNIPTATNSTLVWINSINVYGEGVLDRIYADAKPTRGAWKAKEIVYAKDNSTLANTADTAGVPIGWYSIRDTTADPNGTMSFEQIQYAV